MNKPTWLRENAERFQAGEPMLPAPDAINDDGPVDEAGDPVARAEEE